MSAELVRFMGERYDELEQEARAATLGPWRHDPRKHWRKPGTAWFEEAVFAGPAGAGAVCVAGTGESDDRQSMVDADHIARYDPAAVLADLARKRRVVELYAAVAQYDDVDDSYEHATGRACGLGEAVRVLAEEFAGHPGFVPEWALDR